MASYDQLVHRWVAIALGTTTKIRQLRNQRMPVDGDIIYSYGPHFEIGRLIRDRKGRPVNWLLNGDTWGHTTGRHQRTVRFAVNNTELPVVIIPFQALDAAGNSYPLRGAFGVHGGHGQGHRRGPGPLLVLRL